MLKILVAALTVFALAFAIGLITAEQPQAATCWYTCDCAGTPIYCCKIGNSVSCKVVKNSPIQCTQGYNC